MVVQRWVAAERFGAGGNLDAGVVSGGAVIERSTAERFGPGGDLAAEVIGGSAGHRFWLAHASAAPRPSTTVVMIQIEEAGGSMWVSPRMCQKREKSSANQAAAMPAIAPINNAAG